MGRKIKRYERDAKILTEEPQGVIMVAGTNLYLDESEVLYEKSEFTQKDFDEAFDTESGRWYVEDGWVVGKHHDLTSGMIITKKDYFGDVLLEIRAKMVAPSTHDINVTINGEWDHQKGVRGVGYVTGLEAFYHGFVGFEKSPEYNNKKRSSDNLAKGRYNGCRYRTFDRWWLGRFYCPNVQQRKLKFL